MLELRCFGATPVSAEQGRTGFLTAGAENVANASTIESAKEFLERTNRCPPRSPLDKVQKQVSGRELRKHLTTLNIS